MTPTFTSLLKLIFLKRNIFLILALSCFTCALGWYIFTEKGPVSATEDKYLYDVQSKVHEEIKASNEDLAKVITIVSQSKDTSFSHLKIKTNHPYFIFKNGNLIFWSDYRFVPDYEYIRGTFSLKSVNLPEGKFIVNRRLVMASPDNFEIYSVVNLYRKYESKSDHLKTGYNASIFTVDPQQIDTQASAAVHFNMYADTKEFLFSVVPAKVDNLKNQSIPENVILLGLLGMFFLIAYLLAWIWYFNKKHQFGIAFLLLITYLFFLRAVMLYYSIPFIFYESDLFNPKYFASSLIAPSLGDLMLNLIVVLILLIYLVNYYYKMKSYFALLHLSIPLKRITSVIIVFISFVLFEGAYQQLVDIYEKSQYRLDISLSIDFFEKSLKFSSIQTFVIVSVVYFLTAHLLSNMLIKLNRGKSHWDLYALAIGLITWILISFALGEVNYFVILLHTLYMGILLTLRFPRFLYTFRYQTSIYFFLAALLSAALGTYVIYNQAIRRDFVQKQQFGKKYLAENDEIGEFLLSKANAAIREDSTIQTLIKSDLLPREQVQNYIKRSLLDSYFDYYDVEVAAFDAEGNSLDNVSDAESYQFYEQKYRVQKYLTEYNNIFFVNEANNGFQKQYIDFIPLLNHEKQIVGYVTLDLKKRDDATRDAALADLPTSGEEQLEASNYSYAVFENKQILKTGGKGYNYERKMPLSVVESNKIAEEGVVDNGYKHVGIFNKNGRKIIVSSEKLSPSTIYSNFSFLFLLLVITIIVTVLIYAVRYGFSKMNVNFATKIQIYLNVAFLLPLILVVGITLSIIGTKLSESQEQSYVSQTENAGISLMPAVDRFVQGKMSKQFLTDTLKSIATNTKKYLSVFDTTGRLLVTNKPLSYETGIVSTYLNPEAYIHIIEEKERKTILPEVLGNLNFVTAYVGMKSNDGKLAGVISIPFYDAKAAYEKEVSAVIGSLLNTFTTIFLGLLLLSYFASNVLTVPLRLITNKLRKIDLSKPSEPLSWRSDDEIGVLIRAYNEMLIKLEESKIELTDSNKQSAWQQMAKQVAHEIKNPLTPMKLSLQLLQHKLSKGATIDTAQIKDQIESLTGQIDNLSYIANSFSDFARLPVPKKEVFDFVYEVNKVSNLFLEDRKILLNKDVPNKPIMVLGDRHLTGNIIKNLLVNAIQAVPAQRRPFIKIQVEIGIEAVIFSVNDNGVGIPLENRSKIFMLDFSTKEDGTGVGLALAKWVVDNAKGSIWFETQDNVGSTFHFTLPLAV